VELARLRGLLAPPYNQSRLLLVVGDVGLGKTALLAEAAGRARASGMRILAAVGRESEQDLTFAGLHQLLHPVLDRVADPMAPEADQRPVNTRRPATAGDCRRRATAR
jgi:hypothetical protein